MKLTRKRKTLIKKEGIKKMNNILLNIIEFICAAIVVAFFGMIAANTVYIGLAAICWLNVAVGVYNMFDSAKNIIVRK